ncbi:MAG: hypothetical protein V4597_11650 [Pseudomonadota bacterium]
MDDDTLAAVLALWQQDNTDLPALFTQPPQAGRLKSPQPALYAQLACEPVKREKGGSQGPWLDWRKVTITVRGTKAGVVSALALVGGRFHDRCTLTYPSGSIFIRWRPLSGGKLVQDEKTKAGTDVWQGIVDGEVLSVRAV